MWSTIRFNRIYAEPSRNGLMRPKAVRGSGYKMINMGELFAYNRINNPEMDLVLMSEVEKEKYAVKTGDLLFARQSLIASGAGKCSIVLEVPEITTFESHIIRVRLDQTKAQSLFYYYYFLSTEGKGNVQSLVMQVAAAGIRASELAELFVPYPPLPTQRKIAAILSAYDDLIENNVRRIAILEEMAQSLYREWFVHFRFPGHEKNTMVESPLGMIPEGWKIIKLSRLVETQYGYTESSSEANVGPKYLRGMDINKVSYIQWDEVPYCPIRDTDYKKYKLYVGDIVVIRMADPGKVGIVEKQIDAVFASYLIRLHIISSSVSPYYLFYFLLSDRYQNYVTGASTGTTRKSASAGVITDIDVVVAPKDIRERFETNILAIRQALNSLLNKNANLRRTRDLLLPKLISGELDVEGLDIEVGDDAGDASEVEPAPPMDESEESALRQDRFNWNAGDVVFS